MYLLTPNSKSHDPVFYRLKFYASPLGTQDDHLSVAMNVHHYLCNFPLMVRNFYNIKIVILAFSQFGFSTCDRLSGLQKGRGFDPRWCHWNFSLI